MKYTIIALFALLLTACGNDSAQQKIVVPKEYNSFLETASRETYAEALNQKEFWSKRLREDSSGIGDLGPLASAYTSLFETTGDGRYLKDSETLLQKAISLGGNNTDTYARALAGNYISQHRFKEAKEILEESYKGVSNKRLTEYMLFDVYMEVGEYETAYEFLNKIKDQSDYHYLIRLSKWSDHRGNLEAAITYMEQARDIADSRKSKPLQIWTYSNLGDYYGHAGRIKDSYDAYLHTLTLQPDNDYVKKGLAWIAYSWEKDTIEAGRILDSVMKHHKIPDYYLLKAEMASFEGDESSSERFNDTFLKLVSEGDYGVMYNTYLIEIFADRDPELALELAQQEVEQRATPETYHLLAMAQLATNDSKGALQTIETYVAGKTSEPMALLHMAKVYKANGMDEDVESLREELLEASFEIGPMLTREINTW